MSNAIVKKPQGHRVQSLSADSCNQDPQLTVSETARGQQHMKKVLIIDDEYDTCYLLSKVLMRQKLDVEFANTLADARRSLEKYNPDIILLDNNLPDGLGIDFIEFAKNFSEKIRIIMMTATVDDNFKKQAYKKGVTDFISKPLHTEKLNQMISSFGD